MIKIESRVEQALTTLLLRYPLVGDIVHNIHKQNGRVLLVGGAVRDLMLGLEVKDLDIEVHGLTLQQLEDILRSFGPVSLVGKSFGVLRLHILDVDWSLPRADSSGRKPEVVIDPFMTLEQAFRRRDLTMNAMGIDLVTHELLDPFNGLQDLHAKILRATDPTFFVEDPLRFYRVMQFVGRFEMQPDVALNELCKSMDVSKVSRERIEVEFEKLFLKSKRPSLGIRWLYHINKLHDVLPEVAQLIEVPQNPEWHPEGDVFEHTMQALDAAATLEYPNTKNKLIIMYAALCHDLGKPFTTEEVEGKLISHGHAEKGVGIAKKLLLRITNNTFLIDAVCTLVQYHMLPGQFVNNGAKSSAYKRLARKLAPDVTMQMLASLAAVDHRGRNPHNHNPLTEQPSFVQEFLQRAQQNKVLVQPESPVLHGKDLMPFVQPGAEMGALLKQAYEIQIEEGIQDKQELLTRVLPKK